MVARSVRDAEVVGSSPITPTGLFFFCYNWVLECKIKLAGVAQRLELQFSKLVTRVRLPSPAHDSRVACNNGV